MSDELIRKSDVLNLLDDFMKRKTGQWLINSDGYFPYCSVCYNEPENGKMTNYCPECGAKMEGD